MTQTRNAANGKYSSPYKRSTRNAPKPAAHDVDAHSCGAPWSHPPRSRSTAVLQVSACSPDTVTQVIPKIQPIAVKQSHLHRRTAESGQSNLVFSAWPQSMRGTGALADDRSLAKITLILFKQTYCGNSRAGPFG